MPATKRWQVRNIPAEIVFWISTADKHRMYIMGISTKYEKQQLPSLEEMEVIASSQHGSAGEGHA